MSTPIPRIPAQPHKAELRSVEPSAQAPRDDLLSLSGQRRTVGTVATGGGHCNMILSWRDRYPALAGLEIVTPGRKALLLLNRGQLLELQQGIAALIDEFSRVRK
jgi:hypothetical protein